MLEPPRRGGSNEYPKSMFSSKNKKIDVYPCKPPFYYIKLEFKRVKLYRHVFEMKHSVCIIETVISFCFGFQPELMYQISHIEEI